jgi:hypothetical protein
MECPVVKVIDSPEGLTEFKVKNSVGKRIGFFQVDTTCMDDELMEAFHDFADRHHRPMLHIMPASASIG